MKLLGLVLGCAAICSGQIVVKNHMTGAVLATPLELPDIGVNDFEQLPIDVVNTGSQQVTIGSATATGLYFSLCCEASFVLAAGQSQTLTLQFAPTQTGNFTGALLIDNLSIFLFARSVAAASLFIRTQSGLLQAHAGIPFSFAADPASPGQLNCLLENDSSAVVIVATFSVSGDWVLGANPALPLTLQPGAQYPFTLTQTAPAAQTNLHAVIQVNQWAYSIVTHPALPKLQLKLPNSVLQSGQQSSISIVFDTAPVEAVAGTLTMTLETSTPVAITDPGVLFPSTGGVSIPFTTVGGQLTASFGGQAAATFQTGTTAGVLHFDANLAGSDTTLDVGIQPEPIGIETVSPRYGQNSVSVTVTGFDNTRTAGKMSFSFFDAQGAFIGNPVTADFTQSFYQYFFDSAYNAGGMFEMVATFPVTGNTSLIKSVQVGLINAAGDAQSAVTKFQ